MITGFLVYATRAAFGYKKDERIEVYDVTRIEDVIYFLIWDKAIKSWVYAPSFNFKQLPEWMELMEE